MHSTLQLTEDDPHDASAIAPDIIPAAWADKVLADIARDAKSPAETMSLADVRSPADIRSPVTDQQPPPASGSAGATAATVDMPTVDTKTFRAPPAGEINVAPERPVDVPSRGHRMKSVVTVFLFALCSALAAAAWQHYGAQAKLMIANWTPPFALVASPSPAPAPATTAAQPDAPAVQAAATDQPAVPAAVPAQPQDDAAPAATAPSPDDATQLMQSMARDVADLRQQIVALKGNIAELKAGQQTLARDIAKPSESRPPELRTSIQPPRPRAAVPPRPAAALSHRPAPAYAPAQTAYVPPPMPQAAAPPMPPQQPAPPPAAAESDGEPVVRPPMPLR